jgi:tetratricopeptide (TPR) repeat protein
MSFFKNLFGKKAGQGPQNQPAADPSQDPNMIRVYDGFGRELFVSKSKWRDDVLLPNIRRVWDKPEELYNMIVAALGDGFRSYVVDAANHLFESDPVKSRGACIWGIVLMEEGRLDEAENVFRAYMEKHGEDGVILNNLAKVYSKRGNSGHAEELLWHALEVDPNQANGFDWYVAIFRERGGEDAALDAMRRVASLPGSWRAHIWLARHSLASRDLEKAMVFYAEAISHAGEPPPTDLLMQMTGDLGNHAHLPELVRLTEPHFKAGVHGLTVGNNLIKAHIDLGQLDDAKRLIDQLYALKRPDWQQDLNFWDTEIGKARLTITPDATPQSLKLAMLSIDGPVWLKQDSPASELFPPRSLDAAVVCFIGSSVEHATNSKRMEAQMSDWTGRLSRALPLFLSEQVEFGARARVRTLIPWVVEPSVAFAVGGMSWSDEVAANCARQDEPKADYVVITHLKVQKEPWAVDLRLVRTIDGKRLGELHVDVLPTDPQDAFSGLAMRLLTLLADQADIALRAPPAIYEVPVAQQYANYLLRLEQMLLVRCAAMDASKPEFISGEHEIIDGNIQLCAACPKNVTVRLLLAQTMLAMKKVRRHILPDFQAKIHLLQKDHPLAGPAHGVLERMFGEAFAA